MSFTPTNIANCKLWIDGADSTSLYTDLAKTTHPTNGNNIKVAVDKSGTVADFTQSTSPPVFNTNQFNGLSSVQFDGSMLLSSSSTFSHTQGDVFIVFAEDGGADGQQSAFLSQSLASGSQLISFGINSDSLEILDSNPGGSIFNLLDSGDTFAPSTATIANYRSDGSTVQSWLNATVETFTINAGSNDGSWFALPTGSDNLTIGDLQSGGSDNNQFIGSICEIIVYSSYLSEKDRESVYSYLAGKWGLSPLLAVGSGSITLSGTAAAAVASKGSGSITLSGTAAAAVASTGSGSIVLSGTATTAVASTGSGSITLSGTAAAAVASTGSGSITLSGSAAASVVYDTIGSGGITLSGTAASAFYAVPDLASCVLWIDFSDPTSQYTSLAETTHPASNNDLIATVHDKSGTCSPFTSTSPALYQTGYVLPMATFANSGPCWLTNSTHFTYGSGDFFAVVLVNALSPNMVLSMSGTANDTVYTDFLIDGRFGIETDNGGSATFARSNRQAHNGNYYVMNVRSNGSGYQIYINGLLASLDSSSTNNGNWFNTPATVNNMTIGCQIYNAGTNDNFANGAIGEILVYNAELSSGDRATVEAYLGNKWGISFTNPPTGTWFSDTFTTASNTELTSHSPDTGAEWDLLINNSATLQADTSNQCDVATGSSGNGVLYQATSNYPQANYDVQATLVAVDGGTSSPAVLASRIQDANNMYLCLASSTKVCNGSPGEVRLGKLYGGVFGTLATAAQINDGDVITLRSITTGSTTLYVLQNGTPIITYVDTSNPLTAAGHAGLGCGEVGQGGGDTASQTFDDFSVMGLAIAQGSGSIILSGTAASTVGYLTTGSGAITLGGTAGNTITYYTVGSGSISLSGQAIQNMVGGSITLSGTAASTVTYFTTGSGSIALSGTAQAGEQLSFIGRGSINLYGGAINAHCEPNNIIGGSIALSGTAKSSITYFTTGSGGITLSGKAFSAPLTRGSGSITLSGSAGTLQINHAVGSGSITLSGHASSYKVLFATGSGSIKLSGSAASRTTLFATGSGSLALSGSAGSLQINLTVGSGSLTLSGAASSLVVLHARGSGAIVLTGQAVNGGNTRNFAATGIGGITLSGHAQSLLSVFAKGSGSITLSGSAGTLARYKTLGSGSITLSGVAGSLPTYSHSWRIRIEPPLPAVRLRIRPARTSL